MIRTPDAPTRSRFIARPGGIAAVVLFLLLVSVTSRGAGQKFFDDDPIQREPETQDASKVEEWDFGKSRMLFGKNAGTPIGSGLH